MLRRRSLSMQAVDDIHKAHTPAREKFLTYLKSALNWVYSNSNRRRASGLSAVDNAWWNQINPPDPSDEELHDATRYPARRGVRDDPCDARRR
jgi:hypothetical protein